MEPLGIRNLWSKKETLPGFYIWKYQSQLNQFYHYSDKSSFVLYKSFNWSNAGTVLCSVVRSIDLFVSPSFHQETLLFCFRSASSLTMRSFSFLLKFAFSVLSGIERGSFSRTSTELFRFNLQFFEGQREDPELEFTHIPIWPRGYIQKFKYSDFFLTVCL